MASLANDKTPGRYRMLFKSPDGKRKTIRPGKMPIKQVRVMFNHIERLEACGIDGSTPPVETTRWLAGIGLPLREKLERAGLITRREVAEAMTLSDLIEKYKSRPKWHALSESTQRNSRRSFTCLLNQFGGSRTVESLSGADAADFHAQLMLGIEQGGEGLAPATANLMASAASTLFNFAIDSEIVSRNPFKRVPRGSRRGNNATVSKADSLLVLDALHGTENRLLFALSRWGGLRVPSEPKGLRWCDIDWERERFLVHSPKTERHEGHETRWVPIFPELAPLLDARFEEASEGEDYVLPSFHHTANSKATNLLLAAMGRCRVNRWPRLWHSMRSTRQTELEEKYPTHVVCAWLGNSPQTARAHYLQVTEEHFKRASKKRTESAQQTPVKDSTAG